MVIMLVGLMFHTVILRDERPSLFLVIATLLISIVIVLGFVFVP